MKEKKFVSFKEQMKKILIFYSLIPIILTALLGYGIIYFLSYSAMKNSNAQTVKELAKTTDEIVSQTFEKVESLAENIFVKEALEKNRGDENSYHLFYDLARNMQIKGKIVLYDKDINIVMSTGDFMKNSKVYVWGLFYRMISNPNKTVDFTGNFYFNDGSKSSYAIGRVIKNRDEIEGYLVYYVLEESLKELINDSELFGVLITDRYNNIIITNNDNFKDSFGKAQKDIREKDGYLQIGERRYYVGRKEVYYSNIEIYCISSIEYIVDNFIESFTYITIVFILLVFIMAKVAKRIAIKKTEALSQIMLGIENIRKGNLDTQIQINSNDEFELIGNAYNNMVLNIKKLIEKNKEEATQSIVSEIKQLESQFNPHFLFNTLEMLRYTIQTDISKTNKIILNISSILRFSIENRGSEVILEREIFYVKNYLDIQKFRFGDKFQYFIDVNSGLLEYITPKLIVQPIVENSIKHGYIQEKIFKILIGIKKRDNRLWISIFDNGKGMSRNELKVLREKINKEKLNSKEYMGLYNVQRRIQLLYGKEYGIKIYSTLNRGTYTKIIFPLKKE